MNGFQIVTIILWAIVIAIIIFVKYGNSKNFQKLIEEFEEEYQKVKKTIQNDFERIRD